MSGDLGSYLRIDVGYTCPNCEEFHTILSREHPDVDARRNWALKSHLCIPPYHFKNLQKNEG